MDGWPYYRYATKVLNLKGKEAVLSEDGNTLLRRHSMLTRRKVLLKGVAETEQEDDHQKNQMALVDPKTSKKRAPSPFAAGAERW